MLPASAPASASAWRLTAAALLLTASCQAVGSGLWSQQGETPIFEVLLFNCGWPETAVTDIESGSAWCQFAIAAALLSACGCLWSDRFARGTIAVVPILALAGSWQVLLAVAAWQRDENFRPGRSWGPVEDWLGNWQVFGEVAVRMAAPLAALWLLTLSPAEPELEQPTERPLWLLRWAAAITFAVHGYEALRSNSRFVDLLLSADQRFLSGALSEHVSRQILLPIGVIDLALAVAILVGRWRPIAGYMAVWGLITALSRTVHSGWDGLWETLIRAPNCGVPLAICLYWSSCPAPAPAWEPADHAPEPR